ncbi:lysylphosphatidylglycerol synthase transmembrane domain-containing protein [Pseudonocardia sp. CA-107938]|uniref:lysylphosphatidylglycerol synthase transmembrane domain-containing protein n=1 Tax=Pseudonocardia sp. CA-107938 TaxID=3240021 RepID=UPI003D94EECA
MIRSSIRLLPAAAAVAVLVALALRLGAGDVLTALRSLDAPVLAAALAIGFVSTAASAARWWLIARSAGLRLSLPQAVVEYYRAQLGNAVLPAGMLGDLHRAVSHGRRAGDVGGGLRAVMLERMAGQVVLVLAAVGVLVAQPRLLPVLADAVLPSAVSEWVVPALAVAAAVLVGVGIVFRHRLAPLVTDLRRMATMRVWPGVVVLSAVALVGYLATFVLAARAAGVTAPVADLLPPMLLALLVMGLPVNVGGFGPREAITAVAFGALGLGAAAGFATAVGYGVLCLVSALPGLATFVRRTPTVLIPAQRTPRAALVPAS